jgi:hypothetical protein
MPRKPLFKFEGPYWVADRVEGSRSSGVRVHFENGGLVKPNPDKAAREDEPNVEAEPGDKGAEFVEWGDQPTLVLDFAADAGISPGDVFHLTLEQVAVKEQV